MRDGEFRLEPKELAAEVADIVEDMCNKTCEPVCDWLKEDCVECIRDRAIYVLDDVYNLQVNREHIIFECDEDCHNNGGCTYHVTRSAVNTIRT